MRYARKIYPCARLPCPLPPNSNIMLRTSSRYLSIYALQYWNSIGEGTTIVADNKEKVIIGRTKDQPMTYGSRPFQRKKLLLPLKTPAIARKVSVASNDSMAWDGDRHGIAGTDSGHSARCRRLSDRSRDLLIGPGPSARNLLQRLPNLELKGRRLHD